MSENSKIVVDSHDEQAVEVLVQNEAQLEVTMPLFYVNSGRKELERYVADEGLPQLHRTTVAGKEEISRYVDNEQKPALDDYTQAQKANIADYVQQVSKPGIDDYIIANVNPYSDAAADSASAAEASNQAAQSAKSEAQTLAAAAAASAAEAGRFRDEAEEIVYPGQATESNLGLAKVASAADVAAGSDDTKFLTPLKAAGYFQSKEAAREELQQLRDELAASLITISYQG